MARRGATMPAERLAECRAAGRLTVPWAEPGCWNLLRVAAHQPEAQWRRGETDPHREARESPPEGAPTLPAARLLPQLEARREEAPHPEAVTAALEGLRPGEMQGCPEGFVLTLVQVEPSRCPAGLLL